MNKGGGTIRLFRPSFANCGAKTMHWLLFLLSESENIHMMVDTRLGEVDLGKVKLYRQLHE
jgi:hypothetical protein